MIALIKWLIFGHVHKWETESTHSLERKHIGYGSEKGLTYILRCKKCGKVKRVDLI